MYSQRLVLKKSTWAKNDATSLCFLTFPLKLKYMLKPSFMQNRRPQGHQKNLKNPLKIKQKSIDGLSKTSLEKN